MNNIYAQLAIVLSVFCYVCANILFRKLHKINVITSISIMFLLSSILLLPIFINTNIVFSSYTKVSFLWLIYIGIVPTAIAYLIRLYLVQKNGVQFMSQVTYFIPLFTIFFDWLFFNTFPLYWHLIALLFIVSGIYIKNKKSKKKI